MLEKVVVNTSNLFSRSLFDDKITELINYVLTNIAEVAEFVSDSNGDGIADGLVDDGVENFSVDIAGQHFTVTDNYNGMYQEVPTEPGKQYLALLYAKIPNTGTYINVITGGQWPNIYYTSTGWIWGALLFKADNSSARIRLANANGAPFEEIIWKKLIVVDVASLPLELRGELITAPPTTDWQRPDDWLELPELTNGEQKLIGLYAIFENSPNILSFEISADYTVDWGDGSDLENFDAWGDAQHQYDYAAISEDTLCSRGYKQVIVTITPQSGQNLTAINLKGSNTLDARYYRTMQWLDIAVIGPNVNGFWMSSSSARNILLERFVYHGANNVDDMSECFRCCYSLQVVEMDTSNVTEMDYCFNECFSLKQGPVLNTSAVTKFDKMFRSCGALRSVPTYDFSSAETVEEMFKDCCSLESSIDLSTLPSTGLTSLEQMFYDCKVLKSIVLPAITTITTLSSTFRGCESLMNLVLPNMDSVTDLDLAFYDNFNLNTVTVVGTIDCAINLSATNLSAEAIEAVLTALSDRSATTSLQIDITRASGVDDLTPTQLAIATDKNWTVKTE